MLRVTRGLLLTIVGIGAVSPILCAAQSSNQSGAVFIETNAADHNKVIAFERASNGTLSNVGEFDTDGRGSGGVNDPLESQGSLTLSHDHSLLFAVNAGSGNISVFGVHHAFLTLLHKVASGGSQPVAVAQHNNLVYVLNSGGAGSVVGFRLGFDGQLAQIEDSTKFVTANATGGASLAISPDGRFLAVTERLANNVDVFQIQPNGVLAPIVVNPSPDPGAFSVTFAPNGSAIVSETGPAGATDGSAISSYSILSTGKLASISQGIPTLGAANCWNVVTPDGTKVYVSNAGSSTISGFAIGPNGTLTPLPGTVVGENPAGATNLDIAVSADGKYLYTLNSGAGTIGSFAIQQNGALTNIGEAGDLPIFAGFNGIAAY
ncbi:lactonase family protein [Acidicapsa acidisoli]|uniref:lactonase family protein n=1 Tax=Acidicapsa acidisoli TaxID=1615681 RepID=UPI0021DFE435|nr:lactonase family protein [Acidicapsa acidisoli]